MAALRSRGPARPEIMLAEEWFLDNFYLVAEAADLAESKLAAFRDDEFNDLLGLNGQREA